MLSNLTLSDAEVLYFNSYSTDIGKHKQLWSRNLDKNPYRRNNSILYREKKIWCS
jgi:hypothetical protein